MASTSLAPLYAGWDLHRRRLAATIAALTPEQLRLQVGPGPRSIGEVVAHIFGARAFWFHQIMGEGPAEMASWLGLDDEDESARPLPKLLAGLAATGSLIEMVLSRTTSANLGETYRRVDPGRVRTYTRQMLIWRIMEHDIHHAGELSLALGQHGLPGLPEEYPTLSDSRQE